MKTVKVKFVGFWSGFDYKKNPLYQVMSKHYNVLISDNPDYIICSVFGEPYEYCNYPQIRIMYSAENYIPDFNLIDYGISSYPINFLDRHFSLPLCIYNGSLGICSELLDKNRNYTGELLQQKKYFANFIASHESENSIRGDFFRKLCEYKRIESPGSYLNNMEDPTPISYADKFNFQKKCKFTLCFESTKHEGFVTEKIRDAFSADTIPIYYGSDTVKDIFNEKAFINVSDYDSFDAAIKKVIELDKNDELYLNTLRQPVFRNEQSIRNSIDNLDNFVCNIFDQPINKAYRRSKVYHASKQEKELIYLKEQKNSTSSKSVLNSLLGRELLKISIKKILNNIK